MIAQSSITEERMLATVFIDDTDHRVPLIEHISLVSISFMQKYSSELD